MDLKEAEFEWVILATQASTIMSANTSSIVGDNELHRSPTFRNLMALGTRQELGSCRRNDGSRLHCHLDL